MLAPATAEFRGRLRAHRAVRSSRRPPTTFPRSVQDTPPRTCAPPRQDRPRALPRRSESSLPRAAEGATPTRRKSHMDDHPASDVLRRARPHPVRGPVRPPVPLRLRHSRRAPARFPFLSQSLFPSPAASPRQHRPERQREMNEKSRDIEVTALFIVFVDPRLADRANRRRPARIGSAAETVLTPLKPS